jgi:serine/threonine protein kinase
MTPLDHQRAKVTTLILSPIQQCRCGTRIDVSRYEALQELTCPTCAGTFVVQGQIDRFSLVGVAGHGGTGTVYKAHDPQLGRVIALKVVREDRAADEEVLNQLEAEATITASLNHPHVLRVFSVGRAMGRFYMAMEFVQGGSLDELLERHRVLPEIQVLEIAIQVAQGLQAAHKAGLIHRDVKPGNILFSNAATAKVMDFGLAVFEQKASAAAGSVWGTPFYMPPERLDGEVEDLRSDIYCLGTVLYQMLTGRPPFDSGTPQEVAFKRLSHPAPSVLTFAPRTSNATAFLVKKMLERRKEDRFSTYEELIQSLQFARAELNEKSGGKPARVILEETGNRKAGMWITLGLAAVMLLGIGVGILMMVRKSRAKDLVTPIPEVESAPVPRVEPKPASRPAVANTTASVPSAVSAPNAAGILQGVYQIRNRKTGQVLDVLGFSVESDAQIKGWHARGGPNQRWILRRAAQHWQIVAFHSCKALEIPGGTTDEAVAIKHGMISGSAHQLWKLEPTGDGHYRIVSAASGKALAITDSSGPQGATIGQRAIANDETQQWKLEAQSSLPPEVEPILAAKPLAPAPPMVVAKRGQAPADSKFVPVSIRAVANCDSRGGTFRLPEQVKDTIRPLITGWVDVAGVPFDVLNSAEAGKDLLILKGGQGAPKQKYPKKVEIAMNGARLSKLHILGGVGGWGYPWDNKDRHLGVLAAQITVVHRGGGQEVMQFRNGIEFADYNSRHEVPGSAYVDGFADYQRQARYFSRALTGTMPIEKLIVESFDNHMAPVFVAITGEAAR